MSLHSTIFLGFVTDDSFISMRYAARLLAGLGLTWNDGERVEGFTNLLWVLLTAGLGALGLDLLVAVRCLGFACMFVTLAAFVRYAAARSQDLSWPIVYPLVMFATTTAVAAWTVAGLEQPLCAALLAIVVYLCIDLDQNKNRAFTIGILLSLLFATRPDSLLFATSLSAWIMLRPEFAGQRLALLRRILLPLILSVIGITAFRLSYYGSPVPNTAGVKLGLASSIIAYGLRYLFLGATRFFVPLALAIAAVWACRSDRKASAMLQLLWLMTLPWCAYLILIGGDVNYLWRHWIVVLVLLTFAAIELMRALLQPGATLSFSTSVLMMLTLCVHILIGSTDIETRQVLRDPLTWQGREMGQHLKLMFAEKRPLLAVESAGCLPYYTEFPALDALGLNDAYIPTHSTQKLGTGWIGHDAGNGEYVLSRKPDLVSFCSPIGNDHACWPGGEQIFTHPEFNKNYKLVRFAAGAESNYAGLFWLRVNDGRLGIERQDNSISIPAYLCQTTANDRTMLSSTSSGQRTVTVAPEGLKCPELHLSAGSYTIELQPNLSAPEFKLVDQHGQAIPAQPSTEIKIQSEGLYRLELNVPQGSKLEMGTINISKL